MSDIASMFFGAQTLPKHTDATRVWMDRTWHEIGRSLAEHYGVRATAALNGGDSEPVTIRLNGTDFHWTDTSVDGWHLAITDYDPESPMLGFFLIPGNSVDFANQEGMFPFIAFQLDSFTGLDARDAGVDNPNLIDLSDPKMERALQAYAASRLAQIIRDVTIDAALANLELAGTSAS